MEFFELRARHDRIRYPAIFFNDECGHDRAAHLRIRRRRHDGGNGFHRTVSDAARRRELVVDPT
jgi:hypothetical protein